MLTARYKGMQYKLGIKQLIQDQKITVKIFAKQVGVSEGVVSEWLRRDDRHPSATSWDKVLNVFPQLADCKHPEFRDVVSESELLAEENRRLKAEVQALKDRLYYLERAGLKAS